MLTRRQKIGYFLWAARQRISGIDQSCPGCGSHECQRVRGKYAVTALVECRCCTLRYRVPRDVPESADTFYQKEYSSGFTTDCPGDGELERLKATSFQGSGKDFASYLEVLGAVGVRKGARLLDFGSSWGYGSWQLRKHGFEVFSYEVSKPRARFAKAKLGCNTVTSVAEVAGTIQCFFSAHVIEHLPNPDIFWEAVRTALTRDGVVVGFCPNGDPAREEVIGRKRYDKLWGGVHPLCITPGYLRFAAGRQGFDLAVYSSPYNLEAVRLNKPDCSLVGSELLFVGRRVE